MKFTAADLTTRLTELEESLVGFDAKDPVPAGVGDVFNALLSEVVAIESVGKSSDGSEFAEINCGALRTLVPAVARG